MCDWQWVNFGRFIAEEHYRLARTPLAAADATLGELSKNAVKSVRELAEEAAARVWQVS